MPVRLYALTCGWLTGPLANFLAGEEGRLRVPVPCFLIDHPGGKVLFDSGMHPAVQHDAAGRLGFLARYFDIEFHPGEDVAARLTAIGVDPGSIRYLVTSHLHFDHTGGNACIPNATVIVQRREWEAGRDADLARACSFNRADYDTGQDVRCIDGEHDLFGDGRVVCLPTHGHTPGHQSVRVRLDRGEVVLTGDACYLRRTLDEMHLPMVVHDAEGMRASLRRLRALRDAGAQIIYGHDPEFWATVPQAPAEVPAARP
jgi:glyoxylase-like metal-dependent hydrolase (beta-lactamase superfamily II)